MDTNPIFQRLALLTGEPALKRINRARVAVFGLGGVGSWAAEALARSGIQNLTLVDNDLVDPSNVNRQLQATCSNVGQPKVLELKKRLADLNPLARITPLSRFYSPENAGDFKLDEFDYVLDCIDSLESKTLLIRRTIAAGTTLFSSMGAARKLDPTRIRIASIWETQGCPLARVMRRNLRAAHFEGDFLTVFSPENLPPAAKAGPGSPNGSAVHVTATFGLWLAGLVVQDLGKGR